MGVIAHILLSGVAPFPGRTKEQIAPAVCKKELDFHLFSRYYQGGKLVKDFLSKCLSKKAENRPTAEELLEHPWITTMARKVVVDDE